EKRMAGDRPSDVSGSEDTRAAGPDIPGADGGVDGLRPARRSPRSGSARGRRVRDPRAHHAGWGSREAEAPSECVGFAEEVRSPATEHKTGRTDEGGAT